MMYLRDFEGAITDYITCSGQEPIDGDEHETMYYLEPNDVLEYGLTVLVEADGTELTPGDWQAPMPRSMAEVADCDWYPLDEMARL